MRIVVITISDRSSRGEQMDKSGPTLTTMIEAHGWEVVATLIIPDEQSEIEDVLREQADSGQADVILTTGGTGFSQRDRTPEATKNIIDRDVPGMAEAMRLASLNVTPHAMLSRAVVGIRGKTLIVNLPGSPKAAKENLEVIVPALPHAVQLLSDDPSAEAGHYPGTPMRHI
jgi:molybdopterin adenylyltransferase